MTPQEFLSFIRPSRPERSRRELDNISEAKRRHRQLIKIGYLLDRWDAEYWHQEKKTSDDSIVRWVTRYRMKVARIDVYDEAKDDFRRIF